MGGVTPSGWQGETHESILARVETRVRGLTGIPTLDVRDPNGVLSNIYLPLIEELVTLWELGEIIYNSPDPKRSTEHSYAIVAALRGVMRKEASIGKHPGVAFTFSALVSGSIPRGAIRFYPQGQPDNVWMNSNALNIPAPGTYSVAVESETTGASKTLLMGSTIKINDSPGELSGITVPSNATAGTDLELESNWRNRSDLAIRDEQTKVGAKVETIPGVISARVVETPGYIQVIIDDGNTVANNVIAQAILDAKVQGVITQGLQVGTAVNAQGENVQIYFDRVQVLRAYAVINVKAPAGASTTAVKNAMRAKQPKTSGSPLVWSQLVSAAIDTAGVTDVVSLTIGFAPAPTASVNLLASPIQRIDLALADITVQVAA